MSCFTTIGLDKSRFTPKGWGRGRPLLLNKTQVILARKKAEKTVGWHPTGLAANLYD